MMESESSLVDIIARLKRVQAFLQSAGWFVKANSVALAIAALRDFPTPEELDAFTRMTKAVRGT
jgi:hypothetical protein